MATTLRELIAKVVFRADPSKIKDFDAKLDGLKAKLTGVDAKTNELSATLTKSAERFLGLRVALQDVNGQLDPAQIEAYSEAFRGAEMRALDVRKAIERLRLVDPKNAQLPALEKQLNEVERESKEAAKALEKVGVSLKQAKPDAGAQAGAFGGLSKLLGGLGAAAAAYKAINWGQQLANEARAVGDLAARLAIGTDELQTWSALAEQVGASNEDLAGSVKTLANNINAAAEAADGPAAEAFKKLGLSTAGWKKELPGTMDVLLAAGGALSDLESDTERLAVAQQLLGESGLKLLPAFEGGADAAKKQLDQLRELAVVYDQDFIEKSKEVSKEMGLFERQLKGVGVEILAGVLPPLRDFVRWLTPVVKGVRNAVRDSNALSAALGVGAAAGVLKLVGNFGKLVNILKIGRGILLRFILPFLVLDDVISFLKGEESVIGDILDAMFGAGAAAAVVEELREAWEGVKGATSSLWETLGLLKDRLFETGEAGEMTADEFEMAFIKASTGIAEAFDALFEGIGQAQSDWFEAWKFAWSDLGEWYMNLWSGIVDWLGEKLVESAAKLKSFVSGLPLIGGLLGGDDSDAAAAPAARVAQNAQNGLALGGAPAVDQRSSSTVTVNDHSSITTTLNGVDAQNVGPALRQTERNIAAELKRNKAQVLRQTVGAVGA